MDIWFVFIFQVFSWKYMRLHIDSIFLNSHSVNQWHVLFCYTTNLYHSWFAPHLDALMSTIRIMIAYRLERKKNFFLVNMVNMYSCISRLHKKSFFFFFFVRIFIAHVIMCTESYKANTLAMATFFSCCSVRCSTWYLIISLTSSK